MLRSNSSATRTGFGSRCEFAPIYLYISRLLTGNPRHDISRSTAPLLNLCERGNAQMGDKSPKNTDKKRKQQTKQASKENKATKK